MPVLKNAKHEAFAQAVALGMPASQAYVEHVSRDGKCSAGTAEVTGSRLQHDSKVSLRIAELRKGVSETVEKKFELTKSKWLDRLGGIAEKAETAEDYSAATGALREIGKASAYYEPESVNVNVSGSISIDGLDDIVRQVFRPA